jgi:hypothetical protein
MGYAASLHPPMNRDGCDVQEASKFGNAESAISAAQLLYDRCWLCGCFSDWQAALA